MRYKIFRPWTLVDDEELRLLASEFSVIRIAAKLKRTTRGVRTRASVLGIQLRTIKGTRGNRSRMPVSTAAN